MARKPPLTVDFPFPTVAKKGDLNTRVDASRDQVDAWLAAKSGAPGGFSSNVGAF